MYTIIYRKISELRPYPNNPRTHKPKQIRQIAVSIREYGFTSPVLVSDELMIVAGHGRVAAAKLLGMEMVPTIMLSGLTKTQLRAYVIADNQLALNAGWDSELLALEFGALIDANFDIATTGFSLAEIDFRLDSAADANPETKDVAADQLPATSEVATTVLGDIWHLGGHRLICGDSTDPETYCKLLGDERADLVVADPPYNVPIKGHVSGLGRIKHPEFVQASGEMTDGEFQVFLTTTLILLASYMRDGAIAFIFMDWRGAEQLFPAGKEAFDELKNLIVWKKKSGGMGTCYRSQHELVFMFKHGTGPHTNSFGLGETGRYRTNVWEYDGGSNFSADRQTELAMHPTVKPVALIADAIRDCSKRKQIVLDNFGGSGSTLIAAEKTGRVSRLIELSPHYCDVIVTRWQDYTGKTATLIRDGKTFNFDGELTV